MQAVAGLVGLGDAGNRLAITPIDEPPQQFGVERCSATGAVMAGIDVDAGLSRPLQGGQPLERLCVREAEMTRSPPWRTSHSWVSRSPVIRAAISVTAGTSISQLIAVSSTYGR